MNLSFLDAIKFNKQNLNTFIKILYYCHITSNPKDIALNCLLFYNSLGQLLMVWLCLADLSVGISHVN